MRLFNLLALGLGLVSSLEAAELLHVSFDENPVGSYAYDSCKSEFPGVKWQNGLDADSNRVAVIQGGDTVWSGRSIRVSYPANCLGPTGTGGAPSCGAQWRATLTTTRDSMMLRYYVYFPKGFEWVKGGKLSGLCGSQCNTGGNVPTGDDGWSSRIMWRDSARLVMYLYYAGQGGTYGTDLDWMDSTGKQPLRVMTGVWHELVTKVMLNTPGTNGTAGKANGRVQAWYDGRLAVDSSGFRFRNRDTMHINQFYFSTFFGGKTSDFSPPHDNRIFFDDFTISDSIQPRNGSTGVKPRKTLLSPKVLDRTFIWETPPPSKMVLVSANGQFVSRSRDWSTATKVEVPPAAGHMLFWKGIVQDEVVSGVAFIP